MKRGRVKKYDRSLVVIDPEGVIWIKLMEQHKASDQELNALVKGKHEAIPAKREGFVLIVNEDGMEKQMPVNHLATEYSLPGEVLRGRVVLAMEEGDDVVGMCDNLSMMMARDMLEIRKGRG